MKNNVKRSTGRDLASLRAGCRKVIGRICPLSSSIFGPSNFVFLSDLTWLPGPGPVFASVGDYLWSPTLCCSSSNRRRAFSSRMGAFIRSSSWGSGSRREPSAPGGGSSSSAAAGGLAVVGGLQLLVRGLHQQEEGHSGAGHCSTGLFTRLESLAWSQQGF